MKRIPIILLILLSSLGSGCSTQPPKEVEKIIYVTTPLPLPTRPVLPTLKTSDLNCLSVDIKNILMNRDIARRQYAEDLETIIKSTRPNQ